MKVRRWEIPALSLWCLLVCLRASAAMPSPDDQPIAFNHKQHIDQKMECTDCHNRPSHAIPATPERAVDLAISRGEIPITLPFVRREAVEALKKSYPSDEEAIDAISRSLRDFYKSQHAHGAGAQSTQIDRAVLAAQNIHRHSVFPDMKVTFGTYANNIGHIDAPGCFRCHDDEHVAKGDAA